MARRQAAIVHRIKVQAESPLRTASRTFRGRVIDTHPEHGTLDIVLLSGQILRNVQIQTEGFSGTRGGTNGMPQVYNTPEAYVTRTSAGERIVVDRPSKTHKFDVFAEVAYQDGYGAKPYVTGFFNPNSHEASFHEPNMEVARKPWDVYEVHWTEEGKDIRRPPFGDGDGDHPFEVVSGQWQMVFPDRQRDYPVPQRGKRFGNDRQTFLSVGYHPRPRVFGDGKVSANFDTDKHPWKTIQAEKGDKRAQQKYARGIWLNQRWRSGVGLDTKGNLDIHAEGLGFDSTAYEEREISEGRGRFWTRLEHKGWHKHLATWVRMRPRFDGKDPESVKTAKRTGTYQLRVQEKIDVASRKETEFRTRDTYTLKVGDYDSKWHTGDAGEDPGIHYDDDLEADEKPSLNPEFKTKLGDDEDWKNEDNLERANAAYFFTRPAKAKGEGPQTHTTLINPQKPGTDVEVSRTETTVRGNVTDSLLLKPSHGDADRFVTLQPGQGDALEDHFLEVDADHSADYTVTLKGGSYTVDLKLHVDDVTGKVNLDVGGPNPTSITFDSRTGNVNITGVTLTFNGIEVETVDDPN